MLPSTWALLLGQTAQTPLLRPNTNSEDQRPDMLPKAFQFRDDTSVLRPHEMIELERPGPGVANPDGDLAFVYVTQHSLSDGKTKKQIYITPLNLDATPVHYPILDGGDAFWVDSRTIGHVKSCESSNQQEIYAVSLEVQAEGSFKPISPALIGKLPLGVTAANFKFIPARSTLAFSAYVYDDEDLDTVQLQDEEWKMSKITARAYDSLYVRHWDQYIGPKHSSLFTVQLNKESGAWTLSGKIHALLNGTRHSVPVEPFGGPEDFDVHDIGVVYTSKDPSVNEATHTRQNIYFIPFERDGPPEHLTSGNQGATSNPTFSPDGTKVAWLQMAMDGYESDQNFVVVYDFTVDVRFSIDFCETDALLQCSSRKWDRSPSAITWSVDGNFFYLTTGDSARIKIFRAALPPTPKLLKPKGPGLVVIAPLPVSLTQDHAVGGVQSISNGSLLYTESSFLGPNNLFVLSGLTHPGETLNVHQITKFGEPVLRNKMLSQYEEIWFEGAESVQVQGWVVKPAGWSKADAKSTWPLMFLIHGGPQGVPVSGKRKFRGFLINFFGRCLDGPMEHEPPFPRWNPMMFAQQGYFVVAINPTGSTTFGQNFTDAIAKNWGGRPFIDLSEGYKYVLDIYPEIDPERTVAAGASWGGFAINWIAGHQEEYGFNFKALITHDGIFDTRFGGYATEELFFFMHEFGGPPYHPDVIKTAEKYNPANHVSKWNVPHLVIHGTKDYRLPITDGLAAFTALQLRSVPSRLVVFEGENHWVLRPENSLRWHEEIFSWIDKYVGRGPGTAKLD